MAHDESVRRLVKAHPALVKRTFSLEGTGTVRVVPLLPNMEGSLSGLGAAAPSRWLPMTAQAKGEISPWDACHRLLSSGSSLDASGSFPGLIRALDTADIDDYPFDRRVAMLHSQSALLPFQRQSPGAAKRSGHRLKRGIPA